VVFNTRDIHAGLGRLWQHFSSMLVSALREDIHQNSHATAISARQHSFCLLDVSKQTAFTIVALELETVILSPYMATANRHEYTAHRPQDAPLFLLW
jgi:hypothetical protein